MSMLRLFTLVTGLCILSILAQAQNETHEVTELQFFFDTDPGFGITNEYGNGYSVTVSDGNPVDQSFDIPIPEFLGGGVHTLYVRAKDENNQWSIADRKSIWILNDTYISQEVTAMEYFIDVDPGPGEGTSITTPSGNGYPVTVTDAYGVTVTGVNESLAIEIPESLEPGFHRLYVRALDDQGRWGIAKRNSFYILHAPLSENIVAMQYYFGTDPGAGVAGNGAIIPLPPDDSAAIDIVVEVPPDLDCIPELYVRFQDEHGKWSLAERRSFDNPHSVPLVNFEPVRTGNTITLEAEMANFDTFLWEFNDEITETTAVNPAHLYEIPDIYDVCLTLSNETCGSRTICKTITVPGISNLIPSRTAPTTNFIGDISGGGFVPGTTFKLIGEGLQDIIPQNTLIGGSTRARILCDLSGQPAGIRHLVVAIPNLPEDTMQNAVEILSTFTLSAGQRPKVTISGPAHLWVGAPGSEYTVAITNSTDETMVAIPVSIQVPNVDVEVLSAVENDTTGVLSDVGVFIDDFDTTLNVVTRKIAFILIPYISPGETKLFNFRVAAPFAFTDNMEVIVYSSWSADIPIQGIQRSPTCDDLPACFACAMDVAGYIPGIECIAGSFEVLCGVLDAIDDPANTDYISVLESLIGALLDCGLPVSEAVEVLFDIVGYLRYLESVDGYVNSGDIVDVGDACNDCAMEVYNLLFDATNSSDPNYKSGVGNTTAANHVNGISPLTYQVHFENADTAYAPASFVIIDDIIDSTKFDLSTFTFVSYGFGNHRVDLQLKQTEFAHDLNLNPDKNIVVRNLGKFDAVTGALSWKMLSYSPDSLKLVDDPSLGFLNPNVTSPEGRGFIEFSILPNPSLEHDDIIHNEASITFDFNDPILTNDFINTIDKVKPESEVLPLNPVTNDSVITIQVNLSDSGSGVSNYDLYILENNSSWKVRKNLSGEIVYFSGGVHGQEYKFYTIARDKVANAEDAPINPENNPDAVTVLDTTRTNFYLDNDEDGFGDVNYNLLAYVQPAGYVLNPLDCDDALSSVNPIAIEICNLIDDDCDGETDEGVTTTYYPDADGDGHGDGSIEVVSCTPPEGYSTNGNDCDDAESDSYPGANEIVDDLDNDCDGLVDEGLSDLSIEAGSCETVYLGYEPDQCKELTVIVAGGVSPYTYAWDNGATTSAINACPEEATTYSVTVTDSDGFSAHDIVTVQVVDIRCGNNNDKVLLCHVFPGNGENDQSLCVPPSAVQAHLNHGDYLGICESVDPCAEEPQSLSVNQTAQVVADNQHDHELYEHAINLIVDQTGITLLPNPADRELTIKLGDLSMVINMRLYDLSGKEVLDIPEIKNHQIVKTGSLNNGIYFLNIQTIEGLISKKVVILH